MDQVLKYLFTQRIGNRALRDARKNDSAERIIVSHEWRRRIAGLSDWIIGRPMSKLDITINIIIYTSQTRGIRQAEDKFIVLYMCLTINYRPMSNRRYKFIMINQNSLID